MSSPSYSPEHYKNGVGIDAIDVCDAWNLTPYLFTALKYIQRQGKKEGNTKLDDQLKAIWYLVYEATGSKTCANRLCAIVEEVASDSAVES